MGIDKIKKLIDKLREERAFLLGELFENDKLIEMHAIYRAVLQVREINRVVKYLNGDDKEDE